MLVRKSELNSEVNMIVFSKVGRTSVTVLGRTHFRMFSESGRCCLIILGYIRSLLSKDFQTELRLSKFLLSQSATSISTISPNFDSAVTMSGYGYDFVPGEHVIHHT